MNRMLLLITLFSCASLVTPSVAGAGEAVPNGVVAIEAEVQVDFGEMADAMGLDDAIMTHVFRTSGVVVTASRIAVSRASIEMPGVEFGPMPLTPKTISVHAITSNGERRKGKIVESPVDGIAMIEIEGSTPLVPAAASPTLPKVGTDLIGVARLPKRFGYAPRTIRGYVSATVAKPGSFLVIEGDFSPGDGIFDANGRLVGIATTLPNEPSDLEGFGMVGTAPVMLCAPTGALRTGDAPVAGEAKEGQPDLGADAPMDPEGPEVFAEIDRDSDGTLTPEDFVGYAKTRLIGAPSEILESFAKVVDQNSDGKITRAEFAARFDRLEEVPGIMVTDEEFEDGEFEEGDDGEPSKPDGPPAGWLSDFDAAQKAASEAKQPLVVVFSASWCPPCQDLKKKVYPLESVKKELASWTAVYIDVDQHEALATQHGIEGIPTLIVFDAKGKELRRKVGCEPTESAFLDFLQEPKRD
ncbi:MAG: thioredoxin domain-containing protein [Planctomycetota bacterium]